jgi:hypothetical protein
MITVSNIYGQLKVDYQGKSEFYQFPKLSNLSWVLNNDGFYYVQFTYEDDYFVKLNISDISNQPTWVNTQAGAEIAVNTIASWIQSSSTSSLLATEATLQQVLSAVDNMRDYEVRLVEDSATPNPVTWLEVRYWDAQSGALGAPVYYLPGSTTAGSPVLPIYYINDRTLLTQILAELQGTLDVNVTNAVISVSQSGAWTVTANQGTNPWVISGTVNVGNFPATQNVAVTSIVEVEVKNDVGNPLPISGTVAATQSGTWNIGSITGPVALPTGAATQSTLASVDTRLTPQSRTHNTISTSTTGSVPALSLRGSVLNVGSAAGIWNGISLPAGVSIPWETVGNRDTYAAIPYNATGTTFIIEYTT